MANTTAQLKNVNLLTKAQYDGVSDLASNELYAVETPTVVETYSDASGNWYRIWSDGWIEQGGQGSGTGSAKTINLLKPYKNTKYSIVVGDGYTSNTQIAVAVVGVSKTVSSFSLWQNNTNYYHYWETRGQGE